MAEGGFNEAPNPKQLSLIVRGDTALIHKFSVQARGEDLREQGSVSSRGRKEFGLKPTDASSVEVTLRSWPKLREVTIPFRLTLGKEKLKRRPIDALPEDPRVKVILYQAAKESPSWFVRPDGHSRGSRFVFLIKGENFVAIREKSFKILSFTEASGIELKSNYILMFDRNSKVSRKYATIEAKRSQVLMGRLEGAVMKGSVVMLRGGKQEELVTKLKLDGKPIIVGPFTISGKLDEKKPDKTARVTVEGDGDLIHHMTFSDGDKEILPRRTSGTHAIGINGQKELELKMNYWKGAKEEKILFQVVVGR